MGREISLRDKSDFGRKTWMQSDKSSSAWVTACPKECKTVSSGGSDILWGAATMFDGISGAAYSAEYRRREEGSGVGV